MQHDLPEEIGELTKGVEELKDTVRALDSTVQKLDKAVFGDHNDPIVGKGVLVQVHETKETIVHTNEILGEVRGDIKKFMWAVIVGMVGVFVKAVWHSVPGFFK